MPSNDFVLFLYFLKTKTFLKRFHLTSWEPSKLPTHLYQSFFLSPPNLSNNISMFWYCWSVSTLITLTSLLLITNLTSLFPSWLDTFQHTRTRPSCFNFGLLLTAQKSHLILQVPGNVSRYVFYPESYLQEWECIIFQLVSLLNPYVLGTYTIFSKLKIESVNLLFWFFFFSKVTTLNYLLIQLPKYKYQILPLKVFGLASKYSFQEIMGFLSLMSCCQLHEDIPGILKDSNGMKLLNFVI